MTKHGYIILLASMLSCMMVDGRPEGAPSQACGSGTDVVPAHPGSPSSDPIPYEVDLNGITGMTYTPGQTYTITLRSTSTTNTDFRGFMIQGRVVADNSIRAGTFGSGTDYQPVCDSDTAATHRNADEKTSVDLSWTAPPMGTGPIRFRYAFVDSYTPSVFWANLFTATLSEGTDGGMGNDPHFFLPLANGDHMCFSIQGEPDFAFNLINDKYIQLNGQFIAPNEEDSHAIANVSTFLGDLGLVVKNPDANGTTIIKVSAQDHSILVGNSLTIVKDKPVTVDVSNRVSISIDNNIQASVLKDKSAWLYINTNSGFGFKVRFYKKHLDMFLTKTSGLTKEAHGLIGQFLSVDVAIDTNYNVMKLGNRKPISVKKAPAWPFLGISADCWYGEDTDNQATGMIEGVYTDYVVEYLIPMN